MCVWLSVCDQFVFSEDVCVVHNAGRWGVCQTAWHRVCFLSTAWDVCLVHSVRRQGVCWTAWHHVSFLSTVGDVCTVHSVGRQGVFQAAWHHVCFLSTAGDVRTVHSISDGDGSAQAPPGIHAAVVERKAEWHAELHGALLCHQVSDCWRQSMSRSEPLMRLNAWLLSQDMLHLITVSREYGETPLI